MRPLEELEVSLVRGSLAAPGALPPEAEAALRWAISIARLGDLDSRGLHFALEGDVAAFRNELVARLTPALDHPHPELDAVASLAPSLATKSLQLREAILSRYAGLDPADLDREIREKKLVLALGGGGGTSYVFLGVFALLEELGLAPDLIAATSMGAIMGLFRARTRSYDPGEILGALRSMSWSRLFRILATENRYGLPAALRLYLRGSLSRHVQHEDGTTFTLRDLPIPMLVTVSGIRRGTLPHPLAFYEQLIEPAKLALRPWLLRSKLEQIATVSSELASPRILDGIHLGLDDWTRDFDVVDAVGFSCAVPGLIHYDVLRPDPRMHDLLGTLFDQRELFRLVDGGLTQNVPAQAAWTAVQDGRLGSRNALILALDGFAPRLSTALWLPLQRIAAENVKAATRYAHVVKAFPRTPSPTDLIPSIQGVVRAIQRGRDALEGDAPLIARLLQPLPPLDAIAQAA